MSETVHNHISSSFKVHTCVGTLKFRHSWLYHATARTAGTDLNQGHINNINGVTILVPPVPPDELQNIVNLEAESQKPTGDSGQSGRSIKDPDSIITKVVESSTSSTATQRIWHQGKVFSGKIKF